MGYKEMPKEELIAKIEELEILVKQLLEEKEQEAELNYAWTGNLGHWYWNIKTNSVTFNPLKVISLGYTKDEIPKQVDYQFFTEKIHSEDYQKTMDAMIEHLHGTVSVYEVEYRIRTKDGGYKWFYDRGCITKRNEKGEPVLLAGIVFDITEKNEMKHKLEHKNRLLEEQVSKDVLTNAYNHRALIEHLKKEIDIALTKQKPLSIVIFDLDDFKKINDTKGHLNGDKVLITIVQIMENCIRGTDIVGRYGGEEFVIVLPNTDQKKAKSIAERIRQLVETRFFSDDLKVTISGGIKEYSGESLTEFIHAADLKLYEAKRIGKNIII